MIAKLKNDYQLVIKDVTKSYGDKCVLDDIDLVVRQGEFCTVVGPSGCGKSTLLRMILGQESPTSGEIYIDGEPVNLPDTNRGVVYQRYSLYPHLTVLENVMLGKTLRVGPFERRRRKKEFEQIALEVLERVRLGGHGHKLPMELSGGMQQRVAIAQALVAEPKILMMDEPFGALDPETREEMQVFIEELWEKTGMTIFFVTHDLDEALFLGSRNFVLSQYYTDDRGDSPTVQRGARIVSDHCLGNAGYATTAKDDPKFIELKETIRRDGFNPDLRQHVLEFNLNHNDSFSTYDSSVASGKKGVIPNMD